MSVLTQSDYPSLAAARPSFLKTTLFPAVAAVGLGMVLLYGAAFAETPALHDAAHDARHSAAFPCH